MRQFRLIFGASTLATAAVLAIFMGGLGLGSAILGRRADAHPNPIRFYGTLELLIAISAALSQPMLWAAGKIYIALGGGVVLRLVLATLVLAIPTVLMGGTLPAAARAVEMSDDTGRRKLALLYGLNTLGAVTGAIASTFFMIERLGNRNTLFIAVALNIVIALVALRLNVGRVLQPAWLPASSSLFILAAAAISGFVFLLMELVWYRMLGPILGGSTFTFGLILAVALLGIALGGTGYSLWSRGGPATSGAFALTCALEAALLMLPYALGDRIAVLASFLRVIGHAGFGGFVFGWTIIAAIVVLPPAIVAGVQFPLLIALLGRGSDDVGAHVGRAYAWNTLGAIAGSLAGGFGFLPLFGAKGCWLIASALLVATGIAAAIHARRASSLLFAALAVAAMFTLGPTAAWRHSSIGAGRAGTPSDPNDIRRWEHAERRQLVWDADGRESAIGLIDNDDLAFMVNGKSDGSARGDASTQVMAGLVGAILHPNPRSALVIGLGTGSTAGWLGAIPSMQRVNVVELEPVVLRVAKACTAVNHDVLRNPKVNIRIGDAREVLLTSRDRYDIIFSEPSNPYRAGIASLFTRELYEAASARLSRGGMFLQWVQTYDVDAETIKTIYATMGAVFSQVATWRTSEGDLLLVATHAPVAFDLAQLRQRVASEPYRTALHATWRVESAEGFLSHFVANDRVARVAGRGARINTDDRTPIEFGFARSVGDVSRFSMSEVFGLASALGEQPATGEVLIQRGSDPSVDVPIGVMSADERAHHDFATTWSNGNFRAAMSSWTEHGRWQPVNSAEIAMLAETSVDTGEGDPIPLLETLRKWEPIEADAIEARLLLRRNDTNGATELLRRAFVAYRSNPWPQPAIMSRALDLAVTLGTLDRASAEVLYDALALPFAAGQLNQSRLETRLTLARKLDDCGPRTIASLRAFEPWVPWDRPTLENRARCYSGAPGERASAELAEFIANEPRPLAHNQD
jgi:spermidine synthase